MILISCFLLGASTVEGNGIKEFSYDNFSFFRAELGFGEPYEVIRKAVPKRFASSVGSSHNPVMVSLKYCCVVFHMQ